MKTFRIVRREVWTNEYEVRAESETAGERLVEMLQHEEGRTLGGERPVREQGSARCVHENVTISYEHKKTTSPEVDGPESERAPPPKAVTQVSEVTMMIVPDRNR